MSEATWKYGFENIEEGDEMAHTAGAYMVYEYIVGLLNIYIYL